ncbi:MAG: 1-acyl-sn-glycerol-3-phosphate acyltransferase [Clostridia bacterium]|nr:1-acyl-sn-glycerol-3-phosphate acyltransferase [Clostridia bacterium]
MIKDNDVISDNIIGAIMRADFHACVMPSDPTPDREERLSAVRKHISIRQSLAYKAKRLVAERAADAVTLLTQKDTRIIGIERLSDIRGGAFLTLNHFSPIDSTLARKLVHRIGGGKINIVIKDTNLFMNGGLGFLMKYARTIPVIDDPRYLAGTLAPMISDMIERGEYVLVYPESEMWLNYRKPRPAMPGVYHWASRFGAPIIPLFAAIADLGDAKRPDMAYRLYVGEPIYPDMTVSKRERAARMQEADYSFKISAYESAYQRRFTPQYHDGDIAGGVIYDPYITELFETM